MSSLSVNKLSDCLGDPSSGPDVVERVWLDLEGLGGDLHHVVLLHQLQVDGQGGRGDQAGVEEQATCHASKQGLIHLQKSALDMDESSSRCEVKSTCFSPLLVQ